jgi:molybdate transport system regulatory protein
MASAATTGQSRTRRKAHNRRPALRRSAGRERYELAGRLWVEKDGQTYLGWGRVVLLERIDEYGSLNRAARSMQMGYRHAWDLVDRMNRLSPRPLVETSIGGRGGGGSRLTPEGRAAVANFRKLVEEFGKWLEVREPRLWRSTGSTRRKRRA